MLQSKTNNSGKWLVAVKVILALVAIWFIYRKVFVHETSRDYLDQLKTAMQQPGALLFFFIVMVLMLLNWLTEALKWRFMISKIEKVTTGRALEAVFSGLTISFFTPNRIGEYAGRVFHLHEGKRMQATLITVIESCSQLLITIITGSVAWIIYENNYVELTPWISTIFRVLVIAFCITCILLYFNLDLFEKIFLRFKLSEYWRQIFHVFSLYSNGDLFKMLLLSIARYIMFSTQFYILLKIYGCTFGFFPALLMISMTFFVMSLVPTFTLTEIGIRGAVATYFFGKLTIDVLPVINATFSLWFINLAIPALAGAFFIFNFRLEKNGR